MSAPFLNVARIDDSLIIPDEFTFGSWNGKPLIWRILEIRDSSLLVILRDTLRRMPFKADGSASTWEQSDIRQWLNESFFKECFSLEEQQAILEQVISTPDSKDYGTKGCGETTDLVFCLSESEANHFFANDALRSSEGEYPCWWLRSPGGSERFQSYVHVNGWINSYGYNVDEASVSIRPALVVDLARFQLLLETGVSINVASGDEMILASEYGMEPMLLAAESEDYSWVGSFVSRFGMDASWESFIVERLAECAAAGDAAAIEELFSLFDGVEFGSGALAAAYREGHSSAVRVLMRKGYSLDGSCRKANLINDTPGLRRIRREEYGAGRSFAQDALDSVESEGVIKLLVRQDALPASEYRLLLCAAAKCDQDLFEWMLNPDYDPLPGLGARWANRRVSIMAHRSKTDYPVSKKALRLMWHKGLAKDDPLSVRAMVPYLADPKINDRQELLNLLIEQEWVRELSFLLSVKRMFTPNMLVEGLELARSLKKKDIAAQLAALIKSIGAGSRLA